MGGTNGLASPEHWRLQDRDSERAVSYNKPLVDDDKPCDQYEPSFTRSMDRINVTEIPYDPLERNSNSVVKYIAHLGGLKPLDAGWRTPASTVDPLQLP